MLLSKFLRSAKGIRLPQTKRHRVGYICGALFCLGLAGCESLGVEAWERESLSRAEMQFRKHDIDLALDEHFYFSKEGTSGGRGFAGGGCGCN